MAQESDYVERGKALIARRQFQEAAKVCRLALLAHPQHLEGRLVLGMALLSLGRFEEVVGEMRVALDLDDRSALAWLLRGEALALKGDFVQAESSLCKARALDPSNGRADKLLADIRTALAAGLSGAPVEAMDTKEYPARLVLGVPPDDDLDDEEDLQGIEPETHPVVIIEHGVAAGAAAGGAIDTTVATPVPPVDETQFGDESTWIEGSRAVLRLSSGPSGAPLRRPEDEPGVDDDGGTTRETPIEDPRRTRADEAEEDVADDLATREVHLPPERPQDRFEDGEEGAPGVAGEEESGPRYEIRSEDLADERADAGENRADTGATAELPPPSLADLLRYAGAEATKGSWADDQAATLPDQAPESSPRPGSEADAPFDDEALLEDAPADADDPFAALADEYAAAESIRAAAPPVEEVSWSELEVADDGAIRLRPASEKAVERAPPEGEPSARQTAWDDGGEDEIEDDLDDAPASARQTDRDREDDGVLLHHLPPSRRRDSLVDDSPPPRAPSRHAGSPEEEVHVGRPDAHVDPPEERPPSPRRSSRMARRSLEVSPRPLPGRSPPAADESPSPRPTAWRSGSGEEGQRQPSRRSALEETPVPRAPPSERPDQEPAEPENEWPAAPPRRQQAPAPLRVVSRDGPAARRGSRPLPQLSQDPPSVPTTPHKRDPSAATTSPVPRDPLATATTIPVPRDPHATAMSVSVPARSRPVPAAPRPRRRGMREVHTAITRSPLSSVSRRVVLLVVASAAAVSVVAGVTAFALREYRVGARVDRHRESAQRRIASGTFAGYQAAADEYRRILLDHPSDDAVRASRARALATMSFEFGEPIESAGYALSALGDDASEDAQVARTLVALARGDLPRARRLAAQLQSAYGGAIPRYLVGRVELLQDHPDEAARAISSAVERDPHDPLLLHGLGLAEAGRRHDAAAMEAFARALALSPNHVATIIDRASLQIQRGRDLGAAESFLEGVVSKLAAEASPSELGRAYLALGELHLARGDLEGGRGLLVRASAKRPKDPGATGDPALVAGLAVAYLKAFELDAAETEARRAIESPRGRSAGYLVLAQVALLRGRAKEALSDVEEAGATRPEALLVRGRAHFALGDTARAGADLDEAIRLAPDLVEARVARARVDIAEGRSAQAQHELERMERSRLAPAMVAEGLAEALAAQRQPDRARFWFAKAVERNPLALDARVQLARLFLDDNRVEEARSELKRAVQANAEFMPAWRELAALSLESGDLQVAREEYDALAEKVPMDSAALLGAARARALLGDLIGAEERLTRAEKVGAAGEEVADLRALALLRSGRADDAAAVLRDLVTTAQRAETAGLYLTALQHSGRPLPPNYVARAIPPRLQGTPEVLVAEARGLAEAGRSSAAESLALGALKRGERARVPAMVRAEAYAVLGRAHYDQGSAKNAARYLDAALKLDRRNARACYQMAILHEERKARDVARKLMEEAVAADPSFADAHYELGRLRSQAGDQAAADSFEAYLRLEPRGAYADDARRGIRQFRR
ncbi:MAG: tetratricopeptide repeat protein [Myxococcales bacterium]|nr:tetratricopeptide repeat protein [Myxococcales bacterium]